MSDERAAPSHDPVEGRHDFDFFVGGWRVANRKLADPLAEVPESRRWLEFEATAKTEPILGGLGNYNTYSARDFPGHPGFQGFALRLFDPEAGLWRIWWASTIGRGRLAPRTCSVSQDQALCPRSKNLGAEERVLAKTGPRLRRTSLIR